MLEIFVKEIIWKSEWLKKLWCVWIFIIGDVIVEECLLVVLFDGEFWV